MNAKVVIAVLMGLAFPLAQILPAAVATTACPPAAEACACCDGPDTCPCLDHGDPAPMPLPALPDGPSLGKGSLAPPAGVPVQVVSTAPESRGSAGPGAAAPRALPGYRGVRLSVAFCSFVI